MTLTIPYEWTPIKINTSYKGDITIELDRIPGIRKHLLNQLLYDMSYDDIINVITPQSFEQIVEHYNTEYKE